MKGRTESLVLLLGLLALASCRREERKFNEPPPAASRVNSIRQSDLQPGVQIAARPTFNAYEENAYAVSEGKRLYEWFNCVGCHAHGGGSIGPPLMDSTWIYGNDPANIFATIVEGRPNGMPSFRGKIPDFQVWQIVAYVRSMSGLLKRSVSPSRDDDMSAKQSESQTTPENQQSQSQPQPSAPTP